MTGSGLYVERYLWWYHGDWVGVRQETELALPSIDSVNIYPVHLCPGHFAGEQDKLAPALKQLTVEWRSWEAREASRLD